jgi:hypothetical protein
MNCASLWLWYSFSGCTGTVLDWTFTVLLHLTIEYQTTGDTIDCRCFSAVLPDGR